MLQFGRYIMFILVACLFLQSCATVKSAQELQLGKESFSSGDFKLAFHQLLPVAVAGNPQAQYAVGYMYYYGYGVSADTESGLFWITKSAVQHYRPAMKALELMHRPLNSTSKSNPVSMQNLTPGNLTAKSERLQKEAQPLELGDAVLQSLRTAAADQPEDAQIQTLPQASVNSSTASLSASHAISPTWHPSETTETKPSAVNDAVSYPLPAAKKDKVTVSVSGNYTLQLAGSYNLASLKELKTKLNMHKIYCAHTKNQGRDWYILTYGKFPAMYQAQLAKDDLPLNLREFKPWARKTEDLTWVS